ncbi:metallo-beta-lactamase [Cutibacterium acnes JCM 18909]|nr:metallo-beta-lactamase [Cutibacterium acnes JCM 18909]
MTGAQPWCGEPDAEAIEATTGVTCRTMWTVICSVSEM